VQTPAPRAAAPAAAQQANRAAVLRGVDANFKAIDTNGDASLSAAELQAFEGRVQQQRISTLRQRFEGDFAKLDTNKDGTLSKVEFMVAAPRTSAAAPNGAAIVTQLDRNKDGKISADEYRARPLARFDAIDSNKDGTLSAAERAAAAKARPRG
jgi:hypothetical protein